MILHIRIEKLKPGMYVEDVGLSWLDAPYLYAREGVVRTEEDIKRIKEEGYKEVYINTEKGVAPAEKIASLEENISSIQESALHGSFPKIPLKTELPRAQSIYLESLGYSRDLIRSAREGILPEYGELENQVQRIVSSSFRNEAALLHLFKLRQYDEYTYTHCINVALLSVVYGKFLEIPSSDLTVLGVAALLHDVGKEKIPGSILNKPGRLSEKEFRIVQQHCMEGFQIVRKNKGIPERVLSCILQHHEKYDGTGYPNGIKESEIDLFSTIISIADIFDALTSVRPYKDAVPLHKALQILYTMRDKAHPAEYVEQFIKCVGVYPVGSLVLLSNRKVGVVQEVNKKEQLYPVVKVILDEQRRPVDPYTVDLSVPLQRSRPRIQIKACIDRNEVPLPPQGLLP